MATEKNQWIFNNISSNTGNDRKPGPEKRFSLTSLVELKITIPDETGSGSKVLHQGVIPVTLESETASLMYPDLTKLAGRPLGSPENLDYYARGDSYYSHPGNTYIRALAFRAARYPYNEISGRVNSGRWGRMELSRAISSCVRTMVSCWGPCSERWVLPFGK